MIDGTWEFTAHLPQGAKKSIAEFKTEGTAVTVTRAEGVVAGEFTDNTLTYQFLSDTPIGKKKVKVTLKLEGDKLVGKLKLILGSFDLEGVRVISD